MDSEQSVSIAEEISNALELPKPERYRFVIINGDNVNGYNVSINAFLGTVKKNQVYAIAEKHGLNVIDDREGFRLY
jgi:hypothetical protein